MVLLLKDNCENRIRLHNNAPLSLIMHHRIPPLMERLSVSLDTESLNIIAEYLPKYKGSKANLIRRALETLKEHELMQKKVPITTIETYVDYLGSMEHVIVDIAHWKSIFKEIGDGTDQFWEEVYDIGTAHWKEYYDKGIKNIQQILEYVEKTNWYKLNKDSENSYTLILTVSEASKFVATFFKGFFSRYSRTVEIHEDYKKIRIRII